MKHDIVVCRIQMETMKEINWIIKLVVDDLRGVLNVGAIPKSRKDPKQASIYRPHFIFSQCAINCWRGSCSPHKSSSRPK